ncbi:MAG: CoA transferase [Deltaproteobacteria bacterium]|nr:CoA transferase [Deltaproteobacteria bacterium]
MAKKMFEGLKIVDFTTVIAGPFITKTLAAYGAEVIKVESRTRPDLWRGEMFGKGKKGMMAMMGLGTEPMKPFNPWMNTSAQFGYWNTGKMSLAVDLAKPEGIGLVKKLVARADIVLENFAGGVGKRMGLGYEDLKQVKPDIIMLSSCMQGQTGPHAEHPGYGTQLVNLVGLSGISGWPDRDPAAIGAYTDYVVPHLSILALMAALDYRRRTGQGQYIDQSQYESAVHLMTPLVLDSQANSRESLRVGNRYPHAVPHNAYPCKPTHADRFLSIGIYTDQEWQSFCKIMGNPAWTKDPKFATLNARRQNEKELDDLVEAWTMQFLPEDLEKRLQNADESIPSAVVKSKEEFYGRTPAIKGRSPYAAPHGAYRCRHEDRWCVIAVFNDAQWESFCRVLGDPPWTKEGRFASFAARKDHEEDLDHLIGAWTKGYSPESVMEMMQAGGVPAGIVSTGEDIMELDPQLRHRHFYRTLDHPEIGEGTYRGSTPSFIFSKCPCDVGRAPLMGEHNEYILKEILGMKDDEVQALIDAEVLN